jgi:hypothetical protein
MKKKFVPSLALAAALAAAAPAIAATTLIDFEGATSFASISDYYNGGSDSAGVFGPVNHSISFTGDALALSNDAVGTYFSHAPSAGTVMFSAPGGDSTMNVAQGFTSELSFIYSAATSALDVVTIYSGLNGTGAALGSISLSGNAQLGGCSDSAFCNWQKISLSFAGVGQSISFGGNAGNVAFDNVTINTVSAVPEPQTAAMLAFGIAGLMVTVRRQRRG